MVPGDPTTVLRTRGLITVTSDQIAASEDPFGAIGMGIVSAEALTAGAASIPAPYSNAAWDGWFLHRYFSAPLLFGDATGFGNVSHTIEFDSKGMRKVGPEERVVVMVENASAGSALQFILAFRMLFLEA